MLYTILVQGGLNGGVHLESFVIRGYHQDLKVITIEWWFDQPYGIGQCVYQSRTHMFRS